MRQQLNVDWSRKVKKIDLKPALRKYQKYLQGLGFSQQTTESYVFRAGKYLEFCKTDQPTEEDYQRFSTRSHRGNMTIHSRGRGLKELMLHILSLEILYLT